MRKRGFFDDIRTLSDIIKPIKDSILELEGRNTTLADCYLQLLKIATYFKQMSIVDYRALRNSCIQVFNKR